MKVGIVTQPLYANYGGILQNYALQQVLKRMGHEPVTLDYMPSLSFGRYLLYAGKTLLCSFSPSKRHPLKPFSHFLKRPSEIKSFVEGNITLTRTIPGYTERILKKNGIEALIVGSDQVWRYAYNSHYLEDMYLAFAKDYDCPKVAYAASFGVEKWDYPEDKTEEARTLIKQFKAVSVRENSAADLCRDYLGVEPNVVLDPTLLLEASDYQRFCSDNSDEAPYLAAYVLDINEDKKAFIERIAEGENLRIKMMTVSGSGCSIEEWLSAVKKASFVITDSFHGSIFSILFEKQFLTILNKERGADRFSTLFNCLGLMDRLISEPLSLSGKNSEIDYTSVNARLQLLRKESLMFLSSCFK